MEVVRRIPILFRHEMAYEISVDNKSVTRRTSARWEKVTPGAILVVREPFAMISDSGKQLRTALERKAARERNDYSVLYRADYRLENYSCEEDFYRDQPKWTPGVHMPLWAARMELLVTSVSQESLYAGGLLLPCVGHTEARLEGVPSRERYIALWNQINGEKNTEPDLNQKIWRIEFERIK
jgi:hypothetical protein